MLIYGYGRTSAIVLVVLLILSIACSSPYERRTPDPSEGVNRLDKIIVYRPKNSTVDRGTSFQELLDSNQISPSNFLVTSFPRSHRHLQRYLVSILQQNPEKVRIPDVFRSEVPIPFRFPPEDEGVQLKLDVFKSTQSVDPKTFDLNSTMESRSEDLFIAGRLRSGVAGMGASLENHTSKLIPKDHAYFRVKTTWRYGRPNQSSDPVIIRINDDVLVNFVSQPDPIKRIYLARKAFQRLLKRVAWRMASKIIPHQYDTSFSSSTSDGNQPED